MYGFTLGSIASTIFLKQNLPNILLQNMEKGKSYMLNVTTNLRFGGIAGIINAFERYPNVQLENWYVHFSLIVHHATHTYYVVVHVYIDETCFHL